MHVVIVAADFNGLAFIIATNTGYIAMQFGFIRRENLWLPMFGAENDVHIIFN